MQCNEHSCGVLRAAADTRPAATTVHAEMERQNGTEREEETKNDGVVGKQSMHRPATVRETARDRQRERESTDPRQCGRQRETDRERQRAQTRDSVGDSER